MLPACVSAEKDERICIDFGSYVIVREKCTPMYGTLICADIEETRTWCKLYAETEPVRPESD